MPSSPTVPSSRTILVTSLAWLLLLTGVLMLGLGSLQALGGWWLEQSGERQAMLADPEMGQGLPGWVLRHWWALTAGHLSLAGLTLASGLGLLGRRPWSLRLTQGLLALFALMHLGLILATCLGLMPEPSAASLGVSEAELAQAERLSFWVSLALHGGMATGMGWFIWRLRSPSIVATFTPGAPIAASGPRDRGEQGTAGARH